MAIVFHEADDEHAPFPHRVIIMPAKTVNVRDPHTGRKSQVTYPEQVFIICAHCDHWIRVQIVTCQCREKCHELAQLMAELGERV